MYGPTTMSYGHLGQDPDHWEWNDASDSGARDTGARDTGAAELVLDQGYLF
jgi:hypothetical protein